MIGAVVENIIGGYLHPRASARRMLDAGHGIEVALQMLVLAFVVREIFMVITPGARPEGVAVSLVGYLVSFFDALMSFAVITTLACYVGRIFGGVGTMRDSAVVLGWYTLVTSFVVPLVMPALMRIYEAAAATAEDPSAPVPLPAGPAMIMLATSSIVLWMLASYIAELHRFNRTLSVLSVIIGIALAVSVLVSSFLPLA